MLRGRVAPSASLLDPQRSRTPLPPFSRKGAPEEASMRDGNGNKLSPEEVRKVKSIQGTPGKNSVS